jgi:hypothetical protein
VTRDLHQICALLGPHRHLARQVQRHEDPSVPFDGEVPLWFVASHVPAIIHDRRPLTPITPGCYRFGPECLSTFWIAANELPLADELVPFLIARTGRPLDAFVGWVKTRGRSTGSCAW